METFTPPRPFVPHVGYQQDRDRSLRGLEQEIRNGTIDPPILPLVKECIPITHCFTVQCCYGHFVHQLEPDPENLIPVTHYRDRKEEIEPIRYRIAYLALCIEDIPAGHTMYADLQEMADRNPVFIQFGSADWFSERMPNTYCIQLEPERMKTEDSGLVTWEEASRIEELKMPFFTNVTEILLRHRVL
ncbi:MAG TPA: hypothetical protein HA272_11185 [Methanoregula sp.]|nr:hypothetical protein [Methanoregula sp.]